MSPVCVKLFFLREISLKLYVGMIHYSMSVWAIWPRSTDALLFWKNTRRSSDVNLEMIKVLMPPISSFRSPIHFCWIHCGKRCVFLLIIHFRRAPFYSHFHNHTSNHSLELEPDSFGTILKFCFGTKKLHWFSFIFSGIQCLTCNQTQSALCI